CVTPIYSTCFTVFLLSVLLSLFPISGFYGIFKAKINVFIIDGYKRDKPSRQLTGLWFIFCRVCYLKIFMRKG
ncbi:hypothetical protein, partial [Methanosarcina barkeri]